MKTITLQNYCETEEHRHLLDQWDRENNGGLTPADVSYGSKKRIWWMCEKGHRWQAMVYARAGGSGCPYCSGRRVAPGETDLGTRRPDLAAQWHPEKNGRLRPCDLLCGSHRRVWWLCEKGHVWQATVESRTAGAGCPICTRHTARAGENDLTVTHPQLARQWHAVKNGDLTPDRVLAGTLKKVWWQCEKGHEWQAKVASRANGAGCPVCAGKQVVAGYNDLATAFPQLAAQWDREKNAPLTPADVTPYSNRALWWRCDQGHSYRMTAATRAAQNCGCPYCANRKVLEGFNDLATRFPEIAAQWHPQLNGGLTPRQITAGSAKKVWWICPEDHVWKAVVYSRTGGDKTGCPVCAGNAKRKPFGRYYAK